MNLWRTLPLLLLAAACTGPETITEVVSPAYTARECIGPSPQITAAWMTDLHKSGGTAVPLPKPICVDVEILEETRVRPATWEERLGWGTPPPPASYHQPGCGLAPTDQQTGVIFCARDNDRDEGRDGLGDGPSSVGCDGDCGGDPEPHTPVDPPDPDPTPQPPTPGMMRPGD